MLFDNALVRREGVRFLNHKSRLCFSFLFNSVSRKIYFRFLQRMRMTTPGERRWWLWWRRRRKEGDDRPNQLLNTKLTREFTRLDTSQNGMLSREEVAEGLRERGLAVSKDNIDKFFFRVDSNRDGMICEKEYNKFVI